MARIPPWMIGVSARNKELEREAKAKRIFGVFPHSSGVENGYVAREGWIREDGTTGFPNPYNAMKPIAVTKSQKLAQKKADQMNGFS